MGMVLKMWELQGNETSASSGSYEEYHKIADKTVESLV